MANRVAPRGLQLHKSANSSPLVKVLIPSTDSGVYGKGDVVKMAGGAGNINNGIVVGTVAIIAAGDPIYGVIQGFDQVDVAAANFDLGKTHRKASVPMYALIRLANREDEYVVETDGAIADTDVHLNANITGNAGGTTITAANATTGYSTLMLDASSAGTEATKQLHIQGFLQSPDEEDRNAVNAKIVVRLNNIQVSGGTGTAGV